MAATASDVIMGELRQGTRRELYPPATAQSRRCRRRNPVPHKVRPALLPSTCPRSVPGQRAEGSSKRACDGPVMVQQAWKRSTGIRRSGDSLGWPIPANCPQGWRSAARRDGAKVGRWKSQRIWGLRPRLPEWRLVAEPRRFILWDCFQQRHRSRHAQRARRMRRRPGSNSVEGII